MGIVEDRAQIGKAATLGFGNLTAAGEGLDLLDAAVTVEDGYAAGAAFGDLQESRVKASRRGR